MNRRGLQFLLVVGIAVLGAAPSFGQFSHPFSFTFQDFTGNFANANGLYIKTGSVSNSTVQTFQRYKGNMSSPDFYAVLFYNNSYDTQYMRVYTNYPVNPSANNPVLNSDEVYGTAPAGEFVNFYSATLGDYVAGRALVSQVNPNAPYEEAFPDWESAGTKIPLGFGMGMAFWAAAIALIIPIKWARDLASAAS